MPTPEDLKKTLTKDATEKRSFSAMLQPFMPEIQRALPAHMKTNVERYMRLAVTEFKRNEKLKQCDPRTVFSQIILATQLGLELGVMGQAWLVPYYNNKAGTMDCQLIPGWQGYMDMVHRNGKATAWTGAVFEGDEFDYAYGDTPFLKHKPCGEDDAEKLTHVYAIGRIKGQEWPVIEVWPVGKCTKHRDRYNKVGKRHYSYENWEMYCRKIALLQVLKYLPRSVEMSTAIQLDNAADIGAPGPSLEDAIEGVFSIEDNGAGDPPAAKTGATQPDKATGEMTEEERAAALAREAEEARQ
jgi:recombination protein RecT